MSCKKRLTDTLSLALSDSFACFAKVKYYYWNCKGNPFYAMHMMLKKHSDELLEIVDKIAKSVFINGYTYVQGALTDMVNSTSIKDAEYSDDMNTVIEALLPSYDVLVLSLQAVQLLSKNQGDYAVNHVISECIVTCKEHMGHLRSSRAL